MRSMKIFMLKLGLSLDNIIYSLMSTILQLIVDLSNVQIFSQTSINTFAQRIYVILGLVMVFKMMISFVQILINPDTMNDKEKGAGGILKRVVFSLVLIVLVPSIFSLAREVQNYIVPIIPRVLLGTADGVDDGNGDYISQSNIGDAMAWYSFMPFFTYNNASCNDGSIKTPEGFIGNNLAVYSVASAKDNIDATCSTSDDDYKLKYTYNWGISSVVGVYITLVLVQIALAIAIRAIKFSVCEFVAPIPIASYIDSKTAKSTFDKWVSTSIKVYLDLFIRLISVYFVIFVFMSVFAGDNFARISESVGGSSGRKFLVFLFIIVGLIQFVKEAPKFLSDLLGLKTDGDIGKMLKPGKDLLTGGDFGKTIGGALGAGGAIIGSSIGNFQNAKKNDEHFGTALRRALGGAGSAAIRGAKGVFDGKSLKENFTSVTGKVRGISNRHSASKVIAGQSQDEYNNAVAKYKQDYDDAVEKIQNDSSLTTDEKVQKIKEARKEYEKKKNSLPPPIRPFNNKVSNAWSSFKGMQPINSSGYSKAASILSKYRSDLFTGEAMRKLDEEGSRLDEFTHNYTDDSGRTFNANYTTIKDAMQKVQNGSYKGEIEVDGNVYKVAEKRISELFKSAQKNGAIDYVNQVLKGEISNSAISEGQKRYMGELQGLEIDSRVKQRFIDEANGNFGQFLKDSSAYVDNMSTTAARMGSYEQQQEKK